MKKALCLALLAAPFIFSKASAQLIVNGSFENNVVTCSPNITNAAFNSKVQGVYAFGAASQLDILKDTCGYGSAHDGRYYLGIAVDQNSKRDGLSLSLTAPLSVGRTYKLSYYVRKNPDYDATAYTLGVSMDSAGAGNTIANVQAPTDTNWQMKEHTFLASNAVRHITIEATGSADTWTHLDHFVLSEFSTGTGNTPENNAGFSVYPNPANTIAWIKLGSAFKDEATIIIADITGRIVKSFTVSRENNIPVNVGHLAAGSYIIQAFSSKAKASQYLSVSK